MGVRRGWRLLALLVVLPLTAACGSTSTSDDSSAGQPPSTQPPVVVNDGDVQVGCGGTEGWPATVMAAGLPHVLTRAQVESAFTELLADPRYRDELSRSLLKAGPSATPWRVLRVDGDAYTLGLGRWTATGPHGRATVFGIQGHPGAWTWQGGGDCQLAPVLTPGNRWVHLSAPAHGVDRESTDPEVGVTETACASGRDVRPFLHAPVVRETPTTVTVYWTSTPPQGAQDCIGVAPVDVRLSLPSPVGARTLVDGSTFPPTQVAGPSRGTGR